MSHSAQRRWYPIVFSIAALVLLPLSVLVLSWHSVDGEIWRHLWDTQMPRLLGNTLTLLLGVGTGVTLLGVSLAWLTSLCEFPGRRWLDWALMLPFAIPAYVLAFVFVGLLDFSGPLQSLLREWFGSGLRLPRVRSTGGVILVLVLVFYPYVYLLARSAFLAQGKGLMEAARALGLSPWQAFWRVALPMARPAIGAGLALAMMETLADFGAVSVFNYDTFTTAIYKTWYGFYSLSSATQLASLLLLAVMLVVYGERRARGMPRPSSERPRGRALYRLHGFKATAASAWCILVFLCAFVIPVLQLLAWFWQRGRFDLDERYAALILHTLWLGGCAALLTVACAMLLAFARRLVPGRTMGTAVGLANLGYALPGSVLAVSIMLAFSYLDRELVIPLSSWLGGAGKPLLLGSLTALLLAYLVRFLAVAFGPLESSLARVRPSLPEAARSLGVGGSQLFRRIYLPLLLPGTLSAVLLVFVDVLKEMPATLLMRPFGWDTLAVRIFEMTSEGEWARAALPALTLVLVGLLPVIGLIRRSARQPG
ncbi:iron ABC transporter, permease protein [Azotobacter vinelandii CA]|uniref:Iron ABC transporter, permease protein n=2 Tax=Azotobacter vinelandii TaxID=354 RepID=C1DJ15_AZOVD|nr:iron ABC transporter permease [Azotobacter vinelandii]ACO80834.1 iron ABC transporter, permease protein [Azotobacter vinelandii DJ]AGK15875.1 iron ABC transporter, permease protein [Azotobacter vinelandii CA]AGK22187.1 iron ABC transporter, permease protein [Azotobacter vinelandii CA6]WKN21629.1 iron ABC transporter permease [Azotobacter vinelandii]SFX02235.1 iron(III) transport system permease protein [Azotobacter vinelandii]